MPIKGDLHEYREYLRLIWNQNNLKADARAALEETHAKTGDYDQAVQAMQEHIETAGAAYFEQKMDFWARMTTKYGLDPSKEYFMSMAFNFLEAEPEQRAVAK